MSPSAWNHVSKFFEADEVLHGGFVRLKTCITQMRKVNKLKMLKALYVWGCDVHARPQQRSLSAS